ncbi:MAG: SpoIIE family protein phosphatase, partial [Acidobacteria bacterium]|nr:SpoIIE family protein phosphatase [Acidobacteriota bacterium]
MKLRTQLLLAFSLLAVSPLAAIVFYSYLSSEQAFRDAVELEEQALADEMSQLLTVDRQDLRQRVRALDQLPLSQYLKDLNAQGALPDLGALSARIDAEIGELEPLLEQLRFIPSPEGPLPVEQAREILVFRLPEPEASSPEAPAPPGAGREPAAAPRAPEAPRPEVSAPPPVPPEAPNRLFVTTLAGPEAESAQESGTGLRILARDFDFPIRDGDDVVGRIQARMRSDQLIHSVLAKAPEGPDDVIFAVDPDGKLYTESPEDRTVLQALPEDLAGDAWIGGDARPVGDWLVVQKSVPGTGVRFGVARPVRESLEQIRKAAMRNLVFGIGLVGLAFFGILPLTAHITRHLSALTRGAERIAAGDLQARVPVYSENEIGQLARTFNRMAFELSENQRQLLEQERHRQEQEMQQRLLEAENHRKTQELEEARSFQLSLLPKALPKVEGLELASYTKTATEVGGDYYDMLVGPNGCLTVAIGDATGHGARAGTMVAVIKSLFSSRAAESRLPQFLAEAAATIKGMGLHRMAMALALVRVDGRRVCVSSAGMPPVLLFRSGSREVEEITLPGMPLGGILGYPYAEHTTELAPGDALLLMTDGFPEMMSKDGKVLGYGGMRKLFAEAADGSAQAIIDSLARAVEARS